MELSFSKYQGTGNDFILVDNRSEQFPKKLEIIQELCDRRFGIGSDGLILIEEHPTLDYRMVYFNSDGTQSFCGNGSRCAFAFARHLGIVKEEARFESTDGVHSGKYINGLYHVDISPVKSQIDSFDNDILINTGSPHYIQFVEDLESIDVVQTGRSIRNLSAFSSQNGTNVNFAQLLPNGIKMRTYERGVEDETLSCGSGAAAVALAATQHGMNSPVNIESRGGALSVHFDKEDNFFTNIWLAGPAEKVFEGTTTIQASR